MTAKQNNYDELDAIVEAGSQPEPTSEAEESESAFDVEKEQAVPSQRKFKLKYILLSSVLLSVGVAAVFLDSNDISKLVSSVNIPSLSSGDVKSDLWNTKLNEVISQSQNQYSDLGVQLNQVSSTVKEFDVYKDQALSAYEVAKQNGLVINILLSRLDAIESSVSELQTKPEASSVGINKEYQGQVSVLKAHVGRLTDQMTGLKASMANNQSSIEAIQKAQLEKQLEIEEQVKVEQRIKQEANQPKPVTLKAPWELMAADYRKKVAMLYNPITKQKLTVSLQSKIPNCGAVSDIVEASKAVVTPDCIIRRG
ncbi:MAG: hypothetical protein CL578_05480 [Alteromonadaceae bacterium]|mgnify:FL=1|uniref:Uncharacterized protein n=1 Tax=Paraglaciecola agarilytica NO2 TaxID=1125747 RepID=A0ABQ0I1T0_9ALTE|nr:hypothetical protein [Paraglaciecola agarilytica]MBN24483.1 hypothetical protein [Alteromonadaceae bacterium]GAC03285.1 hypothetical protein GAGA_0420 [Paraglaciecola agarilytica NO2]|tara:strand:- start:13939 stop:14871 length:933 start_codon:yes stop_codon:yes gene_type:complete